MSGLFTIRGVRGGALVVPLLLAVLSGCSNQYPEDLRYPLRKDLLVTAAPSVRPFYTTQPGHLDAGIAQISKLAGGKTLDPTQLSAADSKELRDELEKIFGTPASPRVDSGENIKAVIQDLGDSEVPENAVENLRLDDKTLAEGSIHYRRHCLHCHGLSGDGRGPTGPWLAPSPRDYRQGKFKFVSTNLNISGHKKPRRADLLRTLRKGIEGTTMPSFSILGDEALQQIISYVIHLSIRGEVEFDTIKTILENKNTKDLLEGNSIHDHVLSRRSQYLVQWAQSSSKPSVQPKPYPYGEGDRGQLTELIRRGYAQFINTQGAASCISCHEDFGRQVPFRYDEWGTLVRPANLTAGIYRGGRRPLDLYWRIRGGIPPANMPAATLKETATSDEYWDLVNFVQALPYPQMLPADIREKIYDDPKKVPAKHDAHAAR